LIEVPHRLAVDGFDHVELLEARRLRQ